MKITPFIHRQTPELCYFNVNDIRYVEKPMLGKNVDWYKIMTSKRSNHPVAEIRAKHFKQFAPAKIAKIEVIYPKEFEYLNKIYHGVMTSYVDLLDQIKNKLSKKHNLNGDLTYNKLVNVDLLTFEVTPMPIPKIKITTKQTYIAIK